MPPRGALMPILGIIEAPISDVAFLMNFGSRQGRQRQGAVNIPGCVFFIILVHNSDINMCF